MKAGCKLSRMFEQDKEQFQQPNKEVSAEIFQHRSVSEIQSNPRVRRSEGEWHMSFVLVVDIKSTRKIVLLVFKWK